MGDVRGPGSALWPNREIPGYDGIGEQGPVGGTSNEAGIVAGQIEAPRDARERTGQLGLGDLRIQ
jgi:hypothetical protein